MLPQPPRLLGRGSAQLRLLRCHWELSASQGALRGRGVVRSQRVWGRHQQQVKRRVAAAPRGMHRCVLCCAVQPRMALAAFHQSDTHDKEACRLPNIDK